MMIRFASFGIGALLATALWSQPGYARIIDHNGAAIYDSCLEKGGTITECHCLSREAHTRFSDEELAMITGLTAIELRSLLRASYRTNAEILTMMRRVINADIVIYQTCDTQLLVSNDNDDTHSADQGKRLIQSYRAF